MSTAIAVRIRPSHLVVAALATLALMAALATLAGGGRTSDAREVGALTPSKVFLPIQPKVETAVVDEAPAPAAPARTRVARQPAAQTGTAQPAQGVGTATGGGGDTNVTVENGSNDTDTNSGGAHVGNSADVSANSASHTAEEDGP